MDRTKGYTLIIIAAVLFSTTEIALKILGDAFSPMQLTCERAILGAIVLMPAFFSEMRKKRISFEKEDILFFLKLGLLSVLLTSTILQLSLQRVDASAVSSIYSSNPVFALLFSFLILHDPMKKNHVIAICLEIIGIIVMINPMNLEIDVIGFAEAVLSTLLFSLYCVLSKLRMDRFSSIVISTMSNLFGGIEMLLILLFGKTSFGAAFFSHIGLDVFVDVSLTAGFSWKSALILLYLSTFVVGYGAVMMLKIMQYTSATEASFIYLLKPIIATILGVIVLQDRISASRIIGIGFFVIASLYVIIPVLQESFKKTGQRG